MRREAGNGPSPTYIKTANEYTILLCENLLQNTHLHSNSKSFSCFVGTYSFVPTNAGSSMSSLIWLQSLTKSIQAVFMTCAALWPFSQEVPQSVLIQAFVVQFIQWIVSSRV